jgi:hypothetical protein
MDSFTTCPAGGIRHLPVISIISGYMIQLFKQNPALLHARFSRIENEMWYRISQAIHALLGVQHQQLVVDLLSPNKKNVYTANSQAAEFNCEVLVKFPSDLPQLKLSMLLSLSMSDWITKMYTVKLWCVFNKVIKDVQIFIS